jgi:sugar O-acyltransferase (sialic acid O-acetyltransferase NeuD family)
MKSLYFCGAGNSEGLRLAYKINEERSRWDRMFVLDDDASKHGKKVLGCEVIGGFEVLATADPETSEVVNLVARTTAGRHAVRARIAEFGIPFAQLVSPGVDTFGTDIARDVIVYHNSTVGPETVVGDGSVVFMGAVVGHEARVGTSCVMAANSVLNARVVLGEGVYVGTNATVLPEVKVGAWATIGAGSVVLEDVPDGATVMGVPAEIMISALDKADGGASNVVGVRIDFELERTIGKIWQEILGIPDIEVDQSFFDAGGNSLLAVQMRNHLQQATGDKISLTDVFRFPTVRAFAAHMTANRRIQGHRAAKSRADIRRELHAGLRSNR